MDSWPPTKIEIEILARMQWGYSNDQIASDLGRLGAERAQVDQLVRVVIARRHLARARRAKLIGLSGIALVLTGTFAIAANSAVVRYIWGPQATSAEDSSPRLGVGRGQFVLAYLLGDYGFLIGVIAIIIGIAAIGFSLADFIHARRAAVR